MQPKPRYDPRYRKFRLIMYSVYVAILAHLVGGITWSLIRYLYLDNS